LIRSVDDPLRRHVRGVPALRCGSDEEVPMAARDHPSGNMASPRAEGHTAPPETAACRVRDRPDIVDPVPVSSITLARDPTRDDGVIARFWNGDHRAYGATARVTETGADVHVTVLSGALPEAANESASAVAELQELQIVLAAPVGARHLR
jgi:hypothetical protein